MGVGCWYRGENRVGDSDDIGAVVGVTMGTGAMHCMD